MASFRAVAIVLSLSAAVLLRNIDGNGRGVTTPPPPGFSLSFPEGKGIALVEPSFANLKPEADGARRVIPDGQFSAAARC